MNMNNPKVSVIVAVYKAEKYIHTCVESLLCQTLKDFEILLIDDGSPDKSGKICDEYAEKDKRVRVIHKENGGVSSARQCGIDNAKGEYTIHADPDDWVEPDMLESLYNKAKEEDADMVMCDYWKEFRKRNKQVYMSYRPSSLDNSIIIKEMFQQLYGSCCNKLVRRACYNEYNVQYPLGISLGEDTYENISLLKNDIKVVHLSRAFYHYIVMPDSLTKKYDERSLEQDIKLINLYDTLLEGHECHDYCVSAQKCWTVVRAFNSGYFDSVTFRKLCCKYKSDVLRNSPFHFKVRIYLSFVGLYRFVFLLSKYLKNILRR